MAEQTCIFCKTVAGEMPSQKVYESENVQAILDIHPTNAGHALVMPKKHYESFLDMDGALMQELFVGAQKVAAAQMKALGVAGFNLIVNNGSVAGQLIPHAHIHVIPRVLEDNFEHWPGRKYKEGEMEEVGEKLRQALS